MGNVSKQEYEQQIVNGKIEQKDFRKIKVILFRENQLIEELTMKSTEDEYLIVKTFYHVLSNQEVFGL